MKYFIRVINEIKSVLNALALFQTLLDTLLIFMLGFSVLTFMDINVLFALVPALFYLILALHYRLSRNKLLQVEQKYPVLKEKLRTAADNLYEENPVINELHEEIVNELKNVEASSFINLFSFSYKILVALMLGVAIVVAAQNQVALDYKKIIFENPLVNYIKKTQEVNKAVNSESVKLEGYGDESQIFGEETPLFKKDDQKLNVMIDASGFEINLKDQRQQEDELSTFPSELCYRTQQGCETAESFNENIPKENTELIKKYFKNLAQGQKRA